MLSDPCLECDAKPPNHHTVATHTEHGCVIAGCNCVVPGGRYALRPETPEQQPSTQLEIEQAKNRARLHSSLESVADWADTNGHWNAAMWIRVNWRREQARLRGETGNV